MSNCHWDTYPKARKDHRCSECRGYIRKGTTYQRQTGISDGYPYTWKVHIDCANLFFAMNKDAHRWYDDQIELPEFSLDEIQAYRGYFPHAVCRIEFVRSSRKSGVPQ